MMRPYWFVLAVVVVLACATDPYADTSDTSSGDGDGDGDPSAAMAMAKERPTATATAMATAMVMVMATATVIPALAQATLIECPDGGCYSGLNEYPCCHHGGECNPACDGQDARSSESECDTPLYAWWGDGCTAICGCVGADCSALYESPSACLMAHAPTCGQMDFANCPFETTLGPTMVSGTTSEGPQTFTYGVFGFITGDADGMDIHLATTTDELGNFVWKGPFMNASTVEVVNFECPDALGTHAAFVGLEVPEVGVMGTVTITTLDDTEVRGTVDVDSGEWQLSGEFAVPRCMEVDTQYP